MTTSPPSGTSPANGKSCPTRWKVTVPGEHAELNVTAYAKNQEVTLPVDRYRPLVSSMQVLPVTGRWSEVPVTAALSSS